MSILCGISGVAGIVAPLIDAAYDHFDSYKQFLYGSILLSVIGFVVLLPIKQVNYQKQLLRSNKMTVIIATHYEVEQNCSRSS